MTNDTDSARGFYAGLFGWTPQDASEEFGGYFMFTKDERPVAGAMPDMSGGAAPPCWNVYLNVVDAAATLARVTVQGGQEMVPAMQVGDLGTMAMVIDPGGAVIGIWSPLEFQGFALVAEPGAPVWFELHTYDYDRSLTFYRDVFDWETDVMSDDPGFRYTTSMHDGQSVAGVLDATDHDPDNGRSWWVPYFGVADTDAAAALALELGGSVLRESEDTPYGRLATIADPSGAQFCIMSA
jgi:predicted enzyme related to lactoylglutathione lyase